MGHAHDASGAAPGRAIHQEATMAIARITEISSTSDTSFDDAIDQGVARATRTLRNVRSAWIKDQRVEIENDRVTTYQVNLLITFVLDDVDERGAR
jgi:flavin-binding protein dodecin